MYGVGSLRVSLAVYPKGLPMLYPLTLSSPHTHTSRL